MAGRPLQRRTRKAQVKLVFLLCGLSCLALDSPLRVDSDDPKTVLLGSGTWHLDNTLVLGNAHSNLTIAAAPGAKPVISGDVPVADWRREGELWVAETEMASVRQLYAGLRRLPRSRIPNEGWLRADKLSTSTENIDRSNDNRLLINE